MSGDDRVQYRRVRGVDQRRTVQHRVIGQSGMSLHPNPIMFQPFRFGLQYPSGVVVVPPLDRFERSHEHRHGLFIADQMFIDGRQCLRICHHRWIHGVLQAR